MDGKLTMRNNIDLTGIGDAALDKVQPVALARGGEHLRQVAVERTPVETGNLAGSASVHVEHDRAAVSYPGPYARYQEFTLDLHHEHGQALYLTSTIVSEKDAALGVVAETIRDGLR